MRNMKIGVANSFIRKVAFVSLSAMSSAAYAVIVRAPAGF